MTVAAKSARAGEDGESLEQVKQRFALWREGRKRGERLSSALWDAAAGMAEQHGLQRTAKELHVDYGRLKKRLERSAGPARTGQVNSQFVEMFAPPVFGAGPAAECIVDMENGRGGKMRVELKRLDGLAGLCSAFWNVR